MSFQARHLLACVLVLGCGYVAACGGGHPGGTVGDACGTIGSSDECLSDEICEDTEFDGPYCLFRCDDQSDCAEFEDCNGVSGDDGKACHPKSGDCGDDNDCG